MPNVSFSKGSWFADQRNLILNLMFGQPFNDDHDARANHNSISTTTTIITTLTNSNDNRFNVHCFGAILLKIF